ALDLAEKIIDCEPTFSRGHAVSGWANLKLGRLAEGLAALERAVVLSPGGTLFLGQLGQAYAMAGRPDQAREVLGRLQELARERYVSPYHFAYVYAGLGEQEAAIDWLERAYQERA